MRQSQSDSAANVLKVLHCVLGVGCVPGLHRTDAAVPYWRDRHAERGHVLCQHQLHGVHEFRFLTCHDDIQVWQKQTQKLFSKFLSICGILLTCLSQGIKLLESAVYLIWRITVISNNNSRCLSWNNIVFVDWILDVLISYWTSYFHAKIPSSMILIQLGHFNWGTYKLLETYIHIYKRTYSVLKWSLFQRLNICTIIMGYYWNS